MFDVYIDDIRFKKFDYEGDMNKLAIESGENKALLIFNDDALYQLYIALKNRLETKRMIPVYNRAVEANTADVAEVKHGKWREKLIESNGVAEIKSVCSLCGKTNKRYMPPFCPHCGAKMDKEVETREESKNKNVSLQIFHMKNLDQ